MSKSNCIMFRLVKTGKLQRFITKLSDIIDQSERRNKSPVTLAGFWAREYLLRVIFASRYRTTGAMYGR